VIRTTLEDDRTEPGPFKIANARERRETRETVRDPGERAACFDLEGFRFMSEPHANQPHRAVIANLEHASGVQMGV
jgi:hypothetical protein